jgi:GT2 family glycosyltransferase
MKLAVIIVTYNAIQWHEKCLAQLSQCRFAGNVYIIDNGSTDGTQDLIRTLYPEFIFYQSVVNLGFGKANNLGLKMALEDACTHFLLLNQDASILVEDILLLVKYQENNPHFGILSPLQMYNSEYLDRQHLKTLLVDGFEFVNDVITGKFKKEIYEIGYTNAAIWLISRNCLQKVGGFDPLFPHYGEDVEYAQRVNCVGFKVGLCPTVRGFHLRDQNSIRTLNDRHFFNSYLIKLKNLNCHFWKTYIYILITLIVSVFGIPFGLNQKKLLMRLNAFVKITKKIKTINANRRKCFRESFAFIDYEK